MDEGGRKFRNEQVVMLELQGKTIKQIFEVVKDYEDQKQNPAIKAISGVLKTYTDQIAKIWGEGG